MSDVARVVTVYSFDTAPKECPSTGATLDPYFEGHEALVSNSYAMYGRRSLWYCTATGSGICESWSLAAAGIERLFIVALRGQDFPVGVDRLIMLPGTAAVFMVQADEGERGWFQRYVMGDSLIQGNHSESGVGKHLQVTRRLYIDRPDRPRDLLPYKNCRRAVIADRRTLSNGDEDTAMKDIALILPSVGSEIGALGVWDLKKVPGGQESVLSEAWLELLKTSVIPFDVAARSGVVRPGADLEKYRKRV